jgi:hypothetical protein
MAGVASLVVRHAMILVVGGRQPARIIHVQAAPVGFHHMARETEAGLGGTIHVVLVAERDGEQGKNEKSKESKYFAASANRHGGSKDNDPDHNDRDDQYRISDPNRH